MILPTDEFCFGRAVTRRRTGGGVMEENEGGIFAVPFGRGPSSGLRDSGDAGHEPRGGVDENKCVESETERPEKGKREKLARMIDTEF
jgi:hypothetical protein